MTTSKYSQRTLRVRPLLAKPQSLLGTCLVSLALICAPLRAHGPADYSKLFEEVQPAVVSVNSVTVLESDNRFPYFFFGLPPSDKDPGSPRRASGIGSGVFIDTTGYVLTNAHVILNEDNRTVVDNIEVVTHDKKKLPAKVIGFDIFSDIALLKVENDFPITAARIGNSDTIKVGHAVVAIGHPLGLNYTLTSGIISSLNRSLFGGGTERFVPFIQTDVAINQGNSGGPLLNVNGEVIGINSRIISNRAGRYIGYSLAIPINLAMEVQAVLRTEGSIQRGMLGVTFAPQGISADDAKVWGLDPNQSGVLVNSIVEGSGAEAADILPGDIIIKYDNKPIDDPANFPRFIANTRPGTVVPITLIREGTEIVVQATIGSIEFDGQLTASGAVPNANPFGMVLEDVPPNILKNINQEGGALLRGFNDEDNSIKVPQELYKLRGGDIILGVIINGKLTPVANPKELRLILNDLESDTIGFQIIRGNNPRPFFVTINLLN